MKTIVPDYYADFACIAGKCRHSCCIGWEIDIDEESLARFRAHTGALQGRFARDIQEDDEGAHFILRQHERCPFLNRENLCDIILEMGEESLCQICADHPRFRNFLSDRTEMGLGLCCEEAARMILSRVEKARLVVWEDDGFADILDEDEAEILRARDECIALAQNRDLSIEQRLKQLCPIENIGEWAQELLGLERLDEGWTKRLTRLAAQEHGFLENAEKLPEKLLEIPLEQLLVVFLYRHVAAAVEDGLLRQRVALCALLTRIVAGIWRQEGGGIETLCDIARMCSSEIEYSQENLDAILNAL